MSTFYRCDKCNKEIDFSNVYKITMNGCRLVFCREHGIEISDVVYDFTRKEIDDEAN